MNFPRDVHFKKVGINSSRGSATNHAERIKRSSVQISSRFLLMIVFSVWAIGTAHTAAPTLERGSQQVYQERRMRLIKSIPNGVVVLFGRKVAGNLEYLPFRQSNNFYYLTGWSQPGAALLLLPSSEPTGAPQEILFLPSRNPHEERWTGVKLGPDDPNAPARTGFAEVMAIDKLPIELGKAMKQWNKIYALKAGPHSEEGAREEQEQLGRLAPRASVVDVAPEIKKLRMVKSPEEVASIRKATEASIEAHLAAMKAIRPGMYEFEIAALMKYEFERRGCERPAFPPIVGSGLNSTILHYEQNRRQMEAGDLVVLDVGGEYSGYASDITRTLPVGGRFTPRQREIYKMVLAAQNEALKAARPGASMSREGPNSLHRIALEYLDKEGKRLLGEPLSQYFIHRLGHHVGLSVHDPGDRNAPLAPGMVITIEPGVYIPEESLGVRIEDMILITENGHELLTRRLPRDPDEIEKLMAERK